MEDLLHPLLTLQVNTRYKLNDVRTLLFKPSVHVCLSLPMRSSFGVRTFHLAGFFWSRSTNCLTNNSIGKRCFWLMDFHVFQLKTVTTLFWYRMSHLAYWLLLVKSCCLLSEVCHTHRFKMEEGCQTKCLPLTFLSDSLSQIATPLLAANQSVAQWKNTKWTKYCLNSDATV